MGLHGSRTHEERVDGSCEAPLGRAQDLELIGDVKQPDRIADGALVARERGSRLEAQGRPLGHRGSARPLSHGSFDLIRRHTSDSPLEDSAFV